MSARIAICYFTGHRWKTVDDPAFLAETCSRCGRARGVWIGGEQRDAR